MRENLQGVIAPMLASLKAEGHDLSLWAPSLPEFLDPGSTPPFASKAACRRCDGWISVQWQGVSFRIEGTLFSAEGCYPSLRQPAA